ncbi:MAG: pentapeptide repeat-containing protein [Bacteroidetes bacterium]|nr:pentapeptide repeat-containing protein [Bacteroidota bacterium]
MIKHLTVLIAFLMMIGSQVSAVDPDDKQKLEDTKQCAQCNLEAADLRGANLEGAKMKGAILCNRIMPDGSVIYSGC